MDPGALLKKLSAYGFGGWWMGGTHMIPNPTFLQEIEAKVPKDANVIVGCQKGLRCAFETPFDPCLDPSPDLLQTPLLTPLLTPLQTPL